MTARNTTPPNTIKGIVTIAHFANSQLWKNLGIILGTFGAYSGKSINKLSPNEKLRQKWRRLNKRTTKTS
jgi:hypothetical protein